MRKMLKNLMVQGMYWCMDLILDQHCLSTHTPKNKLTSRPSIINHISKTNPNSPAPKPNQISIEPETQPVTTTKSQKKPSRTSPHWWAKTKKNKEIRRKKLAFRGVGSRPRTRGWTIRWEKHSRISNTLTSHRMISRLVWTWMWVCTTSTRKMSKITTSSTWDRMLPSNTTRPSVIGHDAVPISILNINSYIYGLWRLNYLQLQQIHRHHHHHHPTHPHHHLRCGRQWLLVTHISPIQSLRDVLHCHDEYLHYCGLWIVIE